MPQFKALCRYFNLAVILYFISFEVKLITVQANY
jgi:hypothetical protein